MLTKLEAARKSFQGEVKAATTQHDVEQIKIKYLGRKGIVADFMKLIPALPGEQRATFGHQINNFKNEVAEVLEDCIRKLSLISAPHVKKEIFDITLPGKQIHSGRKHPLTQTIEEIKEVFARLGFDMAYGPEVELEYYNFDALNIPADHPSRTDFDTFYIKNDVLLRSQTSTVQIRIMEKQKPPVRIIAPGRVYRPDTVDARHSFMFHQVEGLLVDEGVSFTDLKGVLSQFIKTYFGQNIQMRLRPSFFPFTEPSAEVDISCSICGGKGCSVCSYSGWVEI